MDREKFNMDFIYSELNNRNCYQEIVYNKCECDVINIFRGTTPKFIFTLPNSITIDDILKIHIANHAFAYTNAPRRAFARRGAF